jgi:hypothetical protein
MSTTGFTRVREDRIMRRFNLGGLEIPFNPLIRFVLRLEERLPSEIRRIPWKITIANALRGPRLHRHEPEAACR